MSDTQRYKISYQTKEAALFALRARFYQIQKLLGMAEPMNSDYWMRELEIARDAIAELEAM